MKHRLPYLLLAYALAVPSCDADEGRGVEPAQPHERRVALVIGNQAYADKPLKNPVNDARGIKAVLERLHFKVVYRENADLAAMDAAMAEFASQLHKGDVGLFYFSGHGMAANETNYLVPIGLPVSTPRAELKARAYDAHIALEKLEEAEARFSLIILDACRSLPVRGSANGLGEMGGGVGSIFVYAAALKQTAEDGSGDNGTFTKHLLAHLEDSGITALQVFEKTQNEVAKETRNTQVPWISHSSLPGPFCFTDCGGPEAQPATAKSTRPADTLESAEALYLARNYAQALPIYRKLAETGSGFAQFRLGSLYENGLAVPVDLREAAKQYRQSGEAGDAFGQYNLGRMYKWHLDSKSVEHNDTAADKLKKDALRNGLQAKAESLARQNDPAAQSVLCAIAYFDGYQDQASRWCRQAAEQGYAAAQFNLGRLYEKAKDPAQARYWYEQAASQNYPMAQTNLGMLYAQGLGGKWSPEKAQALYRAAQAGGDETAPKK